jgi:cell division protein FtsQ
MIRKKRETRQVDLFSGQSLQKELVFDAFDTGVPEQPVDDQPKAFVKSFVNPMLMGQRKDDTSGEVITLDDAHRPPEQAGHDNDAKDTGAQEETPAEAKDDTTETNELLKSDPERLIINHDFADGFYLSEESRVRHREEKEDAVTRYRRERRRKRRFKIAASAILGLLALLLFNWQEWVVHSPLFTVKHVYVQNHVLLDADEVRRLAGVEHGIRLAEVDLQRAAERIRTNPIVRHAVVSRSYPSGIVIRVEERLPFAFINGDELFAVDEAGVALPRLQSNIVHNLPVVSGIPALPVPGKAVASDRLSVALAFLRRVQTVNEVLYYEISEIGVGRTDFLVYLNSVHVPFRIDGEHPVRTAVYLNAAASHLKRQESERGIKEIDLRFDGQVLIRRK